jgi:hypothetical protein
VKSGRSIGPLGTVYSCATDVIHTVDPLGFDLLVTAVVQGRAEVESNAGLRPVPEFSEGSGTGGSKRRNSTCLLRELEIAMGAMPRK